MYFMFLICDSCLSFTFCEHFCKSYIMIILVFRHIEWKPVKISVTTLCVVIFAERPNQILLAKPNLLPERKSLNVKDLFIIIKV